MNFLWNIMVVIVNSVYFIYSYVFTAPRNIGKSWKRRNKNIEFQVFEEDFMFYLFYNSLFTHVLIATRH